VNNKTILDECLEAFDFKDDIAGFSKFSGISYQTLKGWDRDKKVSPLGSIALQKFIENKRLEEKLEKIDTNQELQDFRTIRDILKKY